jgi:hypothetical protein
MLNGLEHVGRAIDLLTLSEGTLVERLRLAMPEFRLSLADPDEWPIDLFPLAEELDEEFRKAQGSAVDRPQARKTAEHLMMLADSVTVLLSEAAHRQLGEILGPERTAQS